LLGIEGTSSSPTAAVAAPLMYWLAAVWLGAVATEGIAEAAKPLELMPALEVPGVKADQALLKAS